MGRNRKLPAFYKKYKDAEKEYVRKSKELKGKPPDKLANSIEAKNLILLRSEVGRLVKNYSDKAWRIYRKIWDGAPTLDDVNKFMAIADEIVTYEEFITVKDKTSFDMHKEVVRSFKEATKASFEKELK